MNSRVMTGISLIVVGLVFFLKAYFDIDFGPLGWTLIGLLLVGGYFATRSYGALIAGCILAGYGIGAFGDDRWMVMREFSLIGLGIGFILIYVIQMLVERKAARWPLIPGIILVILGFRSWRRFWTFLFSPDGWPIILMIVGALILLGGLRNKIGAGDKNVAVEKTED
ncbi:MAG: hypothetical protein OEV00_13275 [Acidobacteriota bacterium]|nr:hypothetical protein [Acidobacteriota bacterium]MDH3786283.1 hypothetical protein [Acidobacteriota bacterium]